MKRTLKNLKHYKIVQAALCLCRVLYYPMYLYITRRVFKYRVCSAMDTIDKIQNGISLVRFGDGEFTIIKGRSIGFQRRDESLKKSLLKVLENPKMEYQIGIPHALMSTKQDKFSVKTFWWAYVVNNRQIIQSILKRDGILYLDASFSRTVTELKNRQLINTVISRTKNIWKNRKVLIIEGNKTRFGVGNDLLSNAESVKRILAPNEGAYKKIDLIYDFITKSINANKISTDTLILIALGPTATVLGARLANEIQCIDIGHFDLQYEFYLRGKYKKIKIDNKYNNEEADGDVVSDVYDSSYTKQIIYTIE